MLDSDSEDSVQETMDAMSRLLDIVDGFKESAEQAEMEAKGEL
jgi:hypothetical protein